MTTAAPRDAPIQRLYLSLSLSLSLSPNDYQRHWTIVKACLILDMNAFSVILRSCFHRQRTLEGDGIFQNLDLLLFLPPSRLVPDRTVIRRTVINLCLRVQSDTSSIITSPRSIVKSNLFHATSFVVCRFQCGRLCIEYVLSEFPISQGFQEKITYEEIRTLVLLTLRESERFQPAEIQVEGA